MESIPQLLARSALEVRARSGSAARVGLEPDELEQLADRLMFAARLPPGQADASLNVLARLFGDDREVWQGISPAFVELMGRLGGPPVEG